MQSKCVSFFLTLMLWSNTVVAATQPLTEEDRKDGAIVVTPRLASVGSSEALHVWPHRALADETDMMILSGTNENFYTEWSLHFFPPIKSLKKPVVYAHNASGDWERKRSAGMEHLYLPSLTSKDIATWWNEHGPNSETLSIVPFGDAKTVHLIYQEILNGIALSRGLTRLKVINLWINPDHFLATKEHIFKLVQNTASHANILPTDSITAVLRMRPGVQIIKSKVDKLSAPLPEDLSSRLKNHSEGGCGGCNIL